MFLPETEISNMADSKFSEVNLQDLVKLLIFKQLIYNCMGENIRSCENILEKDSPFKLSVNALGAVRWHVLAGHRSNMKAGRSLDTLVKSFNSGRSSGLEYFSPSFIDISNRGGKVSRTNRSLLCQYLFMRGEEKEVREFCKVNPDFNMVVRRGIEDGERGYLTVSDKEMANFRRLAAIYRYSVPCFSLDEVDLEKGDKVEIIGGMFEGVVGILESQKGKQGGRVIVKVGDGIGVATYDIQAEYIKVLEFAKGSKRLYDILDSHTARLQRIIAGVYGGSPLVISDIATIDYFLRRYSSVVPDNDKLKSKFYALLAVDYQLTEQQGKAEESVIACLESLSSVTNRATLALVRQLLYVATGDRNHLSEAGSLLESDKENSSSLSSARIQLLSTQKLLETTMPVCMDNA